MICPRLHWHSWVSSILVLITLIAVPAAGQSSAPLRSERAPMVVPAATFNPAPERSPQPTGSERSDSVWEIEFHGGGILSTMPSTGATALPPAGPVFGSTRRVSSYYFGDGALLVNQVTSNFAISPRLAPLDPVLNSALVERQNGKSVGVRVTRRLTSRLAAELSIDYQGGGLRTTDAARAGVEASRASFTTVFTGILNRSSAVTNTQITSAATFAGDEQGHRLSTLGALIVNLRKGGALVPYVAVGAGVLSSSGETPSITLAGNYRFLLGGTATLNESDTLVVRSSAGDQAFVSMFGGGVKTLLTPRFGVRVDVRVYFSGSRDGTFVDATPQVAPGPPFSALTFVGTPSLRFSNFAQPDSTLSGPAISNFQTFTSEGIRREIGLTVGMFFRF